MNAIDVSHECSGDDYCTSIYHVPTNAVQLAAARKALPLCTGVLDYFPDALLAVAELSRVGNEQHNPGEPLHWTKEKSTDEPDALMRHLVDRGKRDTDGIRHSAKVAWRALALLQREIDAERFAGTAVPMNTVIQWYVCPWCTFPRGGSPRPPLKIAGYEAFVDHCKREHNRVPE